MIGSQRPLEKFGQLEAGVVAPIVAHVVDGQLCAAMILGLMCDDELDMVVLEDQVRQELDAMLSTDSRWHFAVAHTYECGHLVPPESKFGPRTLCFVVDAIVQEVLNRKHSGRAAQSLGMS